MSNPLDKNIKTIFAVVYVPIFVYLISFIVKKMKINPLEVFGTDNLIYSVPLIVFCSFGLLAGVYEVFEWIDLHNETRLIKKHFPSVIILLVLFWFVIGGYYFLSWR